MGWVLGVGGGWFWVGVGVEGIVVVFWGEGRGVTNNIINRTFVILGIKLSTCTAFIIRFFYWYDLIA